MLLEVIGDTVENRIIDFLIEGKGFDYTRKSFEEAFSNAGKVILSPTSKKT